MPRSFNCPSCAGPLEYLAGGATIVCQFCGSTVVTPAEIVDDWPAPPETDFGALSLDQQFDFAGRLGKLIRQHKLPSATKELAGTFGLGRPEAERLMERILGGEAEAVISELIAAHDNPDAHTHGFPGRLASFIAPRRRSGLWPSEWSEQRKVNFWAGFIVIAVAVTVLVGIGLFVRSAVNGNTRPVPELPEVATGFGHSYVEFGKEGTGDGEVADARDVAVDAERNIYLVDYAGGRVQIFDAQGTLVTHWKLGSDLQLSRFLLDKDGVALVLLGGTISKYDGKTGRSLGNVVVPRNTGALQDFAIGPAGDFVLVANGEDIIHLDAAGKLIWRSDDVFTSATGVAETGTLVAINQEGIVYAAGRTSNQVLKLGTEGELLRKFGEKGEKKGQFSLIRAIAVSNDGIVFVSDSSVIQFFNADGEFRDIIRFHQNTPYGLSLVGSHELYVAAGTEAFMFPY